MATVTVAATQMACTWQIDNNIANAERLIREAAAQGAQIILLQELFETPYFCIEHSPDYLKLATRVEENTTLRRLSEVARELSVVIPFSWFERAGNTYFNSLAMIDADGRLLGVYRKSHIPEAVCYHEKYYFSPGDTGFRVWDTAYAKLGAGVCWDQWFPESARCMALMGAQILLYPTAIGSQPGRIGVDTAAHWQTVMCGHAGANLTALVASNRIGVEHAKGHDSQMTFYGCSFIANYLGEKVQAANETDECVLIHRIDLEEQDAYRRYWGVFRDRRPELYGPILSLDGRC